MKKWCFALMCFPGLAWAQVSPQAGLSLTPSTGALTTRFTLDASSSRSSQGNTTNLEYKFKTKSGQAGAQWQRQSKFQFQANETGTFTAEVEVRDLATGSSAFASHRYTVRQELQRDVRIEVSNLNPTEGEQVRFEAIVYSSGVDRNQLQSRWDFDSDGRWDTNFQTTLIGTYLVSAGLSSPTVEVKFPDGQIIQEKGITINTDYRSRNASSDPGYTSINTQSRSLKAPVIAVYPRSATAYENTNFILDGSDTRTISGSYLEWVVEGRTIPNQEKINYRFQSSGKKTVILRHCMGYSQPYCLETSTNITIQAKPNDQYLDITWQNVSDRGRAQSTPDYARVTATDRIRFTVRPQGLSEAGQKWVYRWDFNGDGTWDTVFDSKTTVEHQFNEVGDFVTFVEALPTLTTNGLNSLNHFIPVYVERNRQPQGLFDFKQENNFVGERVYYTAQVNDPESGQQVEVRFDSDADGVWDSDFRRQRSWWWVYDQPGTYLVRMQLRDPQGRITEIKKEAEILSMPEPEAKVSVSHREQIEGQSIRLDASESVGRKLTYEWEILGHPMQYFPQGSRTSVRLAPGNYTVVLTVRDRLGVADQVSFPVTFIPKAEGVAAVNPTVPYNTGGNPNLLQFLPGAPSINQDNYILPPGGVPNSPSPFVVEAGTANPTDGFVSPMRAGR